MRILAEDSLVLVIDIQERLVPVIRDSNGILHNTEILIKGLRALTIPMIVTQQYTKGLGMTVPSIAEAAGEGFSCYDKITFSCADDEKILHQIEESGKKNIVICGIEAHICVLQTAIDLISKGYNVILVENCIGSRKESDCTVAVRRAAAEGATITSFESLLFELTRTAKSEVFKEISKLVK